MYKYASKFRKNLRKDEGFTLIEVLVVIILLGIIMTLGTGSYMSSQRKSRDNARKNGLTQLATALEAYHSDFGAYPDDNGAGGMEGCGAAGAVLCVWGEEFSNTTTGTIYMGRLPEDPRAGETFYYDVGAQAQSYQIYARLENTQDSAVQNDSGNPIIFSGLSCGNNTCNYGISSTNTTPEAGRTILEE